MASDNDLIEKNSMAWVSLWAGLWYILRTSGRSDVPAGGGDNSGGADGTNTQNIAEIDFESTPPKAIGFQHSC